MVAESLLDHVNDDAVIIFVGAHPDDETTMSPLLAYCAERCREVVVVSLTRGQSGWNLARGYDDRTLAEVRQGELDSAMGILGCTSVTYDYINGLSRAHPDGLAVHDDMDAAVARWQACGAKAVAPQTHYERWAGEAGDPAETLAEMFARKKPTVVIALEIDNGFTSHPEHITATLAANKAIELYADDGAPRPALFYVYPSEQRVEGSVTLTAGDLQRLGGKDYTAIAWESWNCYESQYGPNDGEKLDRFMKGCIDSYQLKRIG